MIDCDEVIKNKYYRQTSHMSIAVKSPYHHERLNRRQRAKRLKMLQQKNVFVGLNSVELSMMTIINA